MSYRISSFSGPEDLDLCNHTRADLLVLGFDSQDRLHIKLNFNPFSIAATESLGLGDMKRTLIQFMVLQAGRLLVKRTHLLRSVVGGDSV